jgi:heme/copper-type cytochrome/quinol oxidase subunit 2
MYLRKFLNSLNFRIAIIIIIIIIITAIEFPLGDSSPYTSTDKKIRINVHKKHYKTQYK